MNSHSCDYKKVNEDKHGMLEICQICKKRLVTKKDPKTGRIDNKRYIEAHIKDTAQPNGRTAKIFKKYWGTPGDLRFK